jgi:hypothetical protein
MNALYKIIQDRAKARISPETDMDEYISIWVEEAEKLLEELKKENLVESVRELKEIINIQSRIG